MAVRDYAKVDYSKPLQLINDITPTYHEVEYLGFVNGARTEFRHSVRISGLVYLVNDYGEMLGYDISRIRNKPPEPKWRPYTPKELRRLVGKKVKQKDSDSVFLVTGFIASDNEVCVEHHAFNAKELLEEFERADGGPCGVLEE